MRRKLEEGSTQHYWCILDPTFIHYDLFLSGLEFDENGNKIFAAFEYNIAKDILLPSEISNIKLYFEKRQTIQSSSQSAAPISMIRWKDKTRTRQTTFSVERRKGKTYITAAIPLKKEYIRTGVVTELLEALG